MEVWDLYDIDRIKTDLKQVEGQKMPSGYYRMVVHLCIFNSKGQMLIQQRQPFKHTWPDFWDVSVGGKAQSGDSSREAIIRETHEELGLDIDFKDLRPAFTLNFPHGYDDFYIISMDCDINDLQLQAEEVKDVAWARKEEIYAMIDNKIFIPWHKSLIDFIFDYHMANSFQNNSL